MKKIKTHKKKIYIIFFVFVFFAIEYVNGANTKEGKYDRDEMFQRFDDERSPVAIFLNNGKYRNLQSGFEIRVSRNKIS